jgi:hypothetical protein
MRLLEKSLPQKGIKCASMLRSFGATQDNEKIKNLTGKK